MPDSNAKKLAQFLTSSGTYNLYDVQADSTGFFDLPTGTTAQRPTATSGMIRFNSTLGVSEYYNGTTWIAIDAPPAISSISPSNIADSDSDVDITISGTNFSTSASVAAIGQDGSEITPTTVVRTDSTELVATFDGTSFIDAQEDYGIKVTNSSGLANLLSNSLTVNASPVWTVASGSLGTIYDSARTSVSITTGATDDEGATLTYAVASGSLSSGLSLNTSTGAITGNADAVGSDTTSNFTLSVTDGTNTTTRAYSITINSAVVTSYTSTGSGTYSVPSGITEVNVLVVAGAGASGVDNGGGGGAGGLIYRPAFPVTPGGSVSYTVGAGGPSGSGPYPVNPSYFDTQAQGSDSTFGTLTAKGGGAGGNWNPNSAGYPGGSGGGNSRYNDQGQSGGGTGTQPQQPGDSGTYGFGNPGAQSSNSQPQTNGSGAGGGGAGAVGQADLSGSYGGYGGAGKSYSISGSSVTYAYGGGGGSQQYANGNNGIGQSDNGSNGLPGIANRGGGGSAGSGGGSEQTGSGGSGIVIVSY
jgi:hypothetical protein